MLENKQKIIILGSYWLAIFCEGSSRIIIPLYFASIGISPLKIGFMAFAFELFGLLTSILGGYFINRFGYRNGFLASLVFHTIASFGYLSIHGELDVTMMLVIVGVLRAFRGIGKELIETTSTAYLKQTNVKGRRGIILQILFGGKESLRGVGLFVGGGLLTYLGFVESFAVLGVATLVALFIAGMYLSDFRELKSIQLKDFFRTSKRMRYLAVIRLFLYSGRDLWLVVALPIFLTESGVSNVETSLMVALGLVVFGASQVLFSAFLKARGGIGSITLKANRWRFRDFLFPTHLLAALVMASTMYIPHTIEILWWIVIIYNLVSGAATASHNHLHIKYAKKRRSSIDISFYKGVAQLGKTFAVLSSGILYQMYGLSGCLSAATISLLCAAILGYRLNYLQMQRAQRKLERSVSQSA
ncbi:MAG: MFS transporter [Bdellovibrionota bacterium]